MKNEVLFQLTNLVVLGATLLVLFMKETHNLALSILVVYLEVFFVAEGIFIGKKITEQIEEKR